MARGTTENRPAAAMAQHVQDDQLLQELRGILERNPDVDMTDISLSISRGVVTLSGTVEERRDIAALERVVNAKAGVTGINNQLLVRRADDYKTTPEIEAERATRVPKNLDDSFTPPPRA